MCSSKFNACVLHGPWKVNVTEAVWSFSKLYTVSTNVRKQKTLRTCITYREKEKDRRKRNKKKKMVTGGFGMMGVEVRHALGGGGSGIGGV
ncbi:hypothetical protein M0802_004512 [Mischocyttarus mexicanus]|nr:hypothetical protein M0802_004512 [Mischocyttarus mexicanus]